MLIEFLLVVIVAIALVTVLVVRVIEQRAKPVDQRLTAFTSPVVVRSESHDAQLRALRMRLNDQHVRLTTFGDLHEDQLAELDMLHEAVVALARIILENDRLMGGGFSFNQGYYRDIQHLAAFAWPDDMEHRLIAPPSLHLVK